MEVQSYCGFKHVRGRQEERMENDPLGDFYEHLYSFCGPCSGNLKHAGKQKSITFNSKHMIEITW